MHVLPKKVEQVYEEKMDNVRMVKEWKNRNKSKALLMEELMDQRKVKEMREKVQSANLIRKARIKAIVKRS
ncbi:MAG: hypothetical protein H7A36_08025 [Chlamydiales bacterium]|nr:hypothetical protein [Chlamydiales bacterium]